MSIEWRSTLDVGLYELDAATGLDPVRLAVFRQYLEQEYSGPFIHGMGSYEILDMVRRFVCQGRRLDVGSGTASLFWILAAGGDVLTTATDIEPEALAVLREFLAAPSPFPACYHQAAALFGVPAEGVDRLVSRVQRARDLAERPGSSTLRLGDCLWMLRHLRHRVFLQELLSERRAGRPAGRSYRRSRLDPAQRPADTRLLVRNYTDPSKNRLGPGTTSAAPRGHRYPR